MKIDIKVIIGILGLLAMYLLQKEIQTFCYDIASSRYAGFALARIFRFLFNDAFVILIIYGLFKERKYLIMAIYVQIAGIFLILVPYLSIKYFTNYNGPLISFMHRLIVNPLLMMLLIPAFYYQKRLVKDE